ncbi:ABC transporter permease [Pseudalkalibacillus berkeleyi]|uniref:ABC transporter permease n=1 Tax=Pseudalkalibacillus berkeleyi TaxID=1069813 RepID=A0ABS9GXB4_9BACL|nr:ABC transporter permease [Pseudalkalibacillus berkeleyi]MCF6136162.1 ABC transporter permease [Pseudalkalibacillus berkeleyi]
MYKLWIVLAHTYKSKVRSKAFIITTIATLLLVVGLTNMQTIISTFDKDEARQVAVLDSSDRFYEQLKSQVVAASDDVELVKVNGSESDAEKSVREGDYEGLLILNETKEGLPEGVLKVESNTESGWIRMMERSLQQTKVMIATQNLGVNPAELSDLYAPVSFEMQALKENAKTAEELDQARSIVYVLLFIIYFAVIFYGSMIATEVATEKSSRVMEILISSVSPVKQMFGKIFGIALLGLTQFALIFIVGFISMKFAPEPENPTSMESFTDFITIDQLPVSTMVYAVIFFLLGFLLYATLLAMLGSLVNKVEEANQVITPVILIIVVAFMIAMSGLANPEASFVTITSYIPFFTPMIMFLRVGMLNIPIWETLIGIVVLIATIGIFAVIAAKVYRGGVLMYGNATSLKNLKKALMFSKN